MQVEQRQQQLLVARSFGLATHVEDSLDHILHYAQQPHIPMILHIFQASSHQCAMSDWSIEQQFSEVFLGTRFRRLQYHPSLLTHAELTLRQWPRYIKPTGCILCLSNNQVVAHHSELEQFGDTQAEIDRHLQQWLDRSHLLHADLPPSPILWQQLPTDGMEGGRREEEAENAYCDDPDCTKRYQHEHVAQRASDGSLLTSASFLLQSRKEQGMEVFAEHALSRI